MDRRWFSTPGPEATGSYDAPAHFTEPLRGTVAFYGCCEHLSCRLPAPLQRTSLPFCPLMKSLYDDKLIDRQVGRNAQLFARAIADLDDPADRYPYLRILVSLIEQAHPEWGQAPEKDRQIAELVRDLSGGQLAKEEVALVVRARDEERGYRTASPS